MERTLSTSLLSWLIIWFILCWATSLFLWLGFSLCLEQFSPLGWPYPYQHRQNHACSGSHLFGFFFDIFDEACFFFVCFSCLISILPFVSSTKSPSTDFFFMSIFSVRDLFNIPIQSLCSPQEIPSISYVLHFLLEFYFFKELFSRNNKSRYSKNCDECKIKFRSCGQKKNQSFLVHRAQFRGAITSLPINVLRRSIITYYSINFSLHKNPYDFYDAKTTVDAVAFERVYNP